MPECVMLVGVPCSGKTTFVKTLLSQPYWANAVVLSTDNYIEQVAKSMNSTYNEIFEQTIEEAIRKLEMSFNEAKENGRDIIWDQTNLTIKSRRSKLSKLPSFYRRGCVYFPITLEDALERNKSREGKFIPESILNRMTQQLEVPSVSEGFDFIQFY